MKTADSLKLLKDFLKVYNSTDTKNIVSFFTDDCVCEHDSGSVTHGKKELIDANDVVLKYFPDRKMETIAIFPDTAGIAYEWNWSASVMGKNMSIKGVTVFKLRDGKFTYSKDYIDYLSYSQLLKALPPPPSE